MGVGYTRVIDEGVSGSPIVWDFVDNWLRKKNGCSVSFLLYSDLVNRLACVCVFLLIVDYYVFFVIIFNIYIQK